MGNGFKTAMLLALMTALLVWIGHLLGGTAGMIFAFVLAMAMNFVSYWYSDRIVLSMYRAREAGPGQYPELHGMVRHLAERAGLPVPRLFVIPEVSPNAFATGRDPEHAVIAVTEGLLRNMDKEQVMGVLAHEMAHIRNRDILVGSIAATMAGAVMILAGVARWTAFLGGGSSDDEEGAGLGGVLGLIVMSVLAPLAAMLIQMAVSRSREYLADETGARLAGGPSGLASALERLGFLSGRLPMRAEPATAHMFIVNPLSSGGIMSLFSTHPPLEARIARLTGRSFSDSPFREGPSARREAEDTWRRLGG